MKQRIPVPYAVRSSSKGVNAFCSMRDLRYAGPQTMWEAVSLLFGNGASDEGSTQINRG